MDVTAHSVHNPCSLPLDVDVTVTSSRQLSADVMFGYDRCVQCVSITWLLAADI